MNTSARDAYLETQVMTATPQKLQLLLIDAAIRSAQLGMKHWSEENDDAACEALTHALAVVSELMASVGVAQSEVARRLSAIYIFLFRTLTEAQLRRDQQKLADVIRVLMIERETWGLVCEKFGATQAADAAPASMELGMANTSPARPGASHAVATPATPVSSTGFDSSRVTTPTTPTRRAAPVGFPSRDLPATTGGLSFEA